MTLKPSCGEPQRGHRAGRAGADDEDVGIHQYGYSDRARWSETQRRSVNSSRLESPPARPPSPDGAEPAERDVRLVQARRVVDVDHAGAQLRRDLHAAVRVSGQDGVDKAVRRVVDEPDPLRVRVDRHDRCDRGEDLLRPQRHVLADPVHDRRPVEQAVVGAALDDVRALRDGVAEEGVRAVALALVDHRAEADAVLRRVADGDRRGLGGERLDVRLVQVAGHDVAAGRDARLALVVPGRPGADHRRLLEVGVVEDQQRVVAAELERHALELLAGDLGDAAADRAGAGEVDHRRARVADDPLADLLVAGDDVERAGGQAGVGEQRGDQHAAGQRASPATA